jgi:hypothetical protein
MRKSGGFTESLRFAKNQADLQNPCALQKIRRIYRILALYKNQADLQNPCTLQKIRQIYRILALYKKSGGLTESLRFTKNQADDRIIAGIKIPAPGKEPGSAESQLLTSSWSG